MKINRLETHDRLQHVMSVSGQSIDIGMECQKIIDEAPFGGHPIYIFAHFRQIGEDERLSLFQQDFGSSLTNMSYLRQWNSMEDVPTTRLIWQRRLKKPVAEENSMLFKVYPPSDNVKVIWMIPRRELWEQFEKGKMTENELIWNSIQSFINNKQKLEEEEPDDPSDIEAEILYRTHYPTMFEKRG